MNRPAVDPSAVIARMKEVLGVETDGQLARCLGITRGAISHWRKDQKIPMDRVVDVGNRASVNLGWLLHGRGDMRHRRYRPGGSDSSFDADEALDWGVMEIAIRQVERQLKAIGVKKTDDAERHTVSNLFVLIKLLYTNYMEYLRSLLAEGIGREQSLILLERAANLSHDRARPRLEMISEAQSPNPSGEKE